MEPGGRCSQNEREILTVISLEKLHGTSVAGEERTRRRLEQ